VTQRFLLYYSVAAAGAVICPTLNVSNATPNTTNTNYSTVARVTCNMGYAIDPYNFMNNSVDTICTANSTWSISQINCQRTNQLLLYFIACIAYNEDASPDNSNLIICPFILCTFLYLRSRASAAVLSTVLTTTTHSYGKIRFSGTYPAEIAQMIKMKLCTIK
jgi:hypothetical protein